MCEPTLKCKQSIQNLQEYLNEINAYLSLIKCSKAQNLIAKNKYHYSTQSTIAPRIPNQKCNCNEQDKILDDALEELVGFIITILSNPWNKTFNSITA